MNIYLEIFGYVGTALVILSMMMTSVVKLRILNICGSAISMTYAIIGGAWPIVVLNASLILINAFHLIRAFKQKKVFGHIVTCAEDASFKYLLSYYKSDIEKFFPQYNTDECCDEEVHIVYIDGEAAGVLTGTRSGDILRVSLDYAIPKYRDLQVANYLFPKLHSEGISAVTTTAGNEMHDKYLRQLGFVNDGGVMLKNL